MQPVGKILFVFVMMLGSLAIPNLGLTLAPSFDSANESCPANPSSLSSMRNCYRPLLLFAPSVNDPAFKQQIDELRAVAPEMKAREMIVVPIISTDPMPAFLKTDLPHAALHSSEVTAVRSRFKVNVDSFRVILVGKDGSEKFSSKSVIAFDRLSALVDSMPKRKQEVKQRSEDGKPQ